METPIPVTRKLALDLIADAIADHILAKVERAQMEQVDTEASAQTSTKPPRTGRRQPAQRAPK